ncbi:sensor histidine kinase [Oceanobacillus timonensis]|uniref:sensor histidine kinase n=1 Tax=Oceanobacillus timonensis TaxID=1926285 RepID=UPI0009B94496|nr:sensor histidine kinase [Oceanobacillus timonensis]
MKLFLKEHTLLIALNILQFTAILLLYWLDGYRNLLPALYAIFIGFFLLICYLCYQYVSRRSFYKRLSRPLETLDESLQKSSQHPVSEALDDLLRSQYKHYQQQINTIEKEREEHLKLMDQWVHQMKTPISVIELTAQNLDEPDSSSIREETERMKSGLHTILYMARLRTMEQDFHIKPIHLESLVHEVNGENKRFYIRNQVYPKVDERTAGLTVQSDEKWLYFILTQLILNAVKYSAGKSNAVLISMYERGKEAVLEVQDFGIGIPEADKKRIFDAFYTGENGRKFRESTGMGLYLIKEAVEYLHHRIELESQVGEGTIFRIVFSDTQRL